MSDSWVGGDIPGLQAMGNTMKPAPDEIRGIVHALSSGVDTLVGDAHWSGDAAESFRKAWATNAVQAGGLATVVAQVGEAIGNLGNQLAQVEADLYNAADSARSCGAQIGPKGQPLPLVISGDAASPTAAAALAAQADYTAAYKSAMQLAQGFRMHAADVLSDVSGQIEPGGEGLKWDQRITIADYVKGLYVVPNEVNTKLGKTIPAALNEAKDHLRDARKEMKAERAAYAAKETKLPIDNPARMTHLAAVDNLKGLEGTLAAAEAGEGELPASRALNTKLGDIDKLVPGIGETLPKGLGFLKEIPVVDVAASGVVAEFQARDDEQKGWSGTEARVKDYAAAGAGLAAGAGVVALAPEAAPVGAVVLGGGALVVGVGDFAYQGFHEHWSEDIHDHGVLAGLGTGVGNMGKNTGGDMKDMAVGLWHGTKSVWDKVF